MTTEAVVGEPHVGVSPVLDDLTGLASVRGHADYEAVIHALEEVPATATTPAVPAVGGAKGAIDRTVITDALLSETSPGVTPVLVSTDRDILTRLAQRYAVAPTPFAPTPGQNVWNELVTTYTGGRFTVEILGHRLTVIFQ